MSLSFQLLTSFKFQVSFNIETEFKNYQNYDVQDICALLEPSIFSCLTLRKSPLEQE